MTSSQAAGGGGGGVVTTTEIVGGMAGRTFGDMFTTMSGGSNRMSSEQALGIEESVKTKKKKKKKNKVKGVHI